MATDPNVAAVAVVGAGISGLAAARALRAHGVAVKVFDKGRGAGGRASTRRHQAPGGSYTFDHGAQYFTARDPAFRRHVDSWVEAGIAARWDGRIGVVEGGRVELKEEGPERFVGVPGMSAVARHLAAPLDVACATRVGKIERRDKHWRLEGDDGAALGDFGAVLVSTPPAQAVPLLTGASELQVRAAAVAMRPCWAVMVAFEGPLELPFDGAFVAGSPLSWVARNGSKPGRLALRGGAGEACWVLHAAPEWSTQHLEAAADDVATLLLAAFFAATGLEPRATLFARAHRWRYAIAEHPLDAGCLWRPDLRIGACGDWCAGSKIEGAFLSGMAAAGRILGRSDRDATVPLSVAAAPAAG